MKRSARILKRRIVYGFGLAALLFLASCAAVFHTTSSAIGARDDLLLTYQIMERVTALFSDIQDAETGQRGFLLTGEQRYLGPYYRSVREIEGTLRQVELLSRRSARDQLRDEDVVELRALIRRKVGELQRTVELRSGGRNGAALAVVHQGLGQDLMEEIRAKVDSLLASERTLQERQAVELARMVRMRIFEMGVIFGFALLLMCAMLAGVLRQVRRREKMQAQLEENEERLRLAIDGARLGAWELDLENRTIQLSGRLGEMFGLGAEIRECPLSVVLDRVHPEDRERMVRELEEGIRTSGSCDIIRRVVHPDGEVRWIRCKGGAMQVSSGKVRRMFGISIDITESKQSETRFQQQQRALIQASRMSALGEMSKGVAHEINNPLAAITLQSELLLSEIRRGGILPALELGRIEAHVRRIGASVNRAAGIVQSLREFARDAGTEEGSDGFSTDQEKVGVESVIQHALALCGRTFEDARVLLQLDIPDPRQPVYCRPSQISQALYNVLQNALYAARNGERPHRWVRIRVGSEPLVTRILVQDSGDGVAPAIRDRIMDPFFTTKPVGTGAGLGLSVSRGLIERNHGTIRLLEGEASTSFLIELPQEDPVGVAADPVARGREAAQPSQLLN